MGIGKAPEGSECIFSKLSEKPAVHHTQQLNVDDGAVIIDHENGDHIIHIRADNPSKKNYIEV